jgi:pyruvate dehydrogenase E1 component alpha subunit
MTYRHKGHSRSDPATYRPQGELEAWLERDPILVLQRQLEGAGVDSGELQEVQGRAEHAVRDALERARSWPDPQPQSRLEYVWA